MSEAGPPTGDDARLEDGPLQGAPLQLVVDDEASGTRLDAFLAGQLPSFSRAHWQRVIDAGGVQVDGRPGRSAERLRTGQRLDVVVPEMPRAGPEPEAIPLAVIYEDDDIAVIDKPPGMVVHPSRGHGRGTLAAALAHRFDTLSGHGGPTRPGIVHRLDRDTSGVIVVARNDAAHARLAEQFAGRTVEKEYLALVAGVPDRDRDVIKAPVGVHPHQREKMAIRAGHHTSREAETFYEVVRRFRGFAHLKVLPRTGRTHQIRVHLAHIGCAVLCDRHYGSRRQITRGELCGKRGDANDELLDEFVDDVLLARQALHARRIRIVHPTRDEPMEFTAPIPPDLQATLDALEKWRSD